MSKNKVAVIIKGINNTEKLYLKVVEECTELNEACIKTVNKPLELKPPIDKFIEEAGDVLARIEILSQTLGKNVNTLIKERKKEKIEQLYTFYSKK
jgi:NTP pyrophosphatase (non-canonical NTP hydrolase)